MFQIHLEECGSTQEYFKQNWKKFKAEHPHENDFIVSTTNQTKGIGRRKNAWNHFRNNLAFSFNLKAHAQVTLTSLEVGILLCCYFQKHFKVRPYLKWPNDLINQKREKLGGILCHFLKLDTIVVGCGLNLYLEENEKQNENYKLKLGGLLTDIPSDDQFRKTLPYQIAKFVQQNRLTQQEVISKWPHFCGHLNTSVKIGDLQSAQKGIFKGIGPQGDAILEIPSKSLKEKCQLISILSGTLHFLDTKY